METLEIDGITYQRVSSAARENGYTADYVGQLCRARKINAKLVGRTWYVEKEAIGGHKRSKVRSNSSKTKESLIAELKVHSESNTSTPVSMHPLFAAPTYRQRLMETEVKYETDVDHLIPTLVSEKSPHTHQIRVQKSIDVLSEEETPAEVPELPKEEIKWNGTIVVAPVEEETEESLPEEGTVETQEAITDVNREAIEESEESVFVPEIMETKATEGRVADFLTVEEQADILGVTAKPIASGQVLYFSRLPVALATLVTCAFLATATFMQTVWVYESGTPTRQPYMTTAYSVTSLSNLASSIMSK